MQETKIEKIRKRNGRVVKFRAEKITQAIYKATQAIGSPDFNLAQKISKKVVERLYKKFDGNIPTVEQVQDIVEEALIEERLISLAKAYILYREQHREMRELSKKMNIDLVDKYVQKKDWQVKENSNMTYSLQGLNNYVSSEVTKEYWLNKIYPEEIRNAYYNGDFHIHDLGLLSVYCVGWDLSDLLVQGFKGAAGKIESSPAKHFRSALGQIVNFFYTCLLYTSPSPRDS